MELACGTPVKRRQFGLRALFLFVAAIAMLTWGLAAWFGPSREYRQGYRAGRTEAEAEWAGGQPTFYVTGDGSYGLPPQLHPETGLPYNPIAGCCVDDYIMGREEGHNRRIQELLVRSAR
jgi:hypothetical protein